jgi:hypothetical protein
MHFDRRAVQTKRLRSGFALLVVGQTLDPTFPAGFSRHRPQFVRDLKILTPNVLNFSCFSLSRRTVVVESTFKRQSRAKLCGDPVNFHRLDG